MGFESKKEKLVLLGARRYVYLERNGRERMKRGREDERH